MNSYSFAETMRHKRSNFSSFGSQKINDKVHIEQESYSPQPLQYRDIILLQYSDRFIIGLADTAQLSPGILHLKQAKSIVFAMMEILPVNSAEHDRIIKTGQRFYLRSHESNLYLCAQDELLQKFTNIVFKKECNNYCEFTFERGIDNSEGVIYNRQTLKIKNVASGLFIHIQQENQDLTRFKHLWLSQLSDDFKVTVLNRHQAYPDFLNNQDIILLSAEIKTQKRYIGVSKRKGMYDSSQKKDAVSIDINSDYFEKDNCEIQYYNQEDGRKRFLASCFWRVIKSSFNHDLTYLIKNKQEIYLQHLETGLYLSVDTSFCLGLDHHQNIIRMENEHKFKTQFSIKNKFEPIYVKHSVSITSPIAQKHYFIERTNSKNYVTLFFSEILGFFDNLVKTMVNPRVLNQNRQELMRQIKFYVFVYQQLQNHIQQFEDQGFCFFEYTLKILQILKIILKDEKIGVNDAEMMVRKSLLNPLIIEIIKFISLIVIVSETFQKITDQDQKQTKQIIQVIFVLYSFSFKYTLNLMVTLASTNPDLVVKLLSEKIYKAEHFEERVELIESINEIIDQFRRINFDQKYLKEILEKQHKLIVEENGMEISFQRKEHSIFDLFESISRYETSQQLNNKEERETFYFFYYLLSIIKILFSNNNEQLSQSESNISENQLNSKNLIKSLSESFGHTFNINGKMIILDLIYQMISEMYRKEFITFTKLNFVVFTGATLQKGTQLADILKVSSQNTLQWIFTKEQIVMFMQEILSDQWQNKYPLMLKIKYFTKIINLLTAMIITATYDFQTFTLIEQFGIYVSTIFYRKKVNLSFFREMRQQINAYHQKMSFLIVDGIKIYLDNLILKLDLFFDAILTQKKRLYIYPLCNDRQNLFRFEFFQLHYTQVMMNKRIRGQIKAIEPLLGLNEQKLQVNGLVLNDSTSYAEGIQMIERILQDLDCLAIIMESFRVYGQEKQLKDNLVASMKLKILNIQDLLKTVFKNKMFHKCSQAFNLSSHLFQFILENSSEQQLIMPLLESLQERISHNQNIFSLLRQNKINFFRVIMNPKYSRSSKVLLKWIGKQIENLATPVHLKQYEFLYVQIVQYMQNEFIINLLFLVNILKQIGLNHPTQEEVLYSKLMNFPQIEQFITNCSSLKTFKLAYQKLEVDKDFFNRENERSLQLITIFRICSDYPHLMQHLNNILPYKDIRQGMEDHHQYFRYKPLLSYLITQLKQEPNDLKLINLYIIFIGEHISEFRHYSGQLNKYKVRQSFSKEKEAKAMTYFCRAYSNTSNQNKRSIIDDDEAKKLFYWEFLMWIPFYQQTEGLIKNLEQIILLILQKTEGNQNIDDNLQKIKKDLMEIRSLNLTNLQNQKQFIKQINDTISLIKIYEHRKKSVKRGRSQITKTDGIIEQIYKTLVQYDILKPLLCNILRPLILTSSFEEGKREGSIQSSVKSIKINIKQQSEIMEESQDATLRDRSHHSLITPVSYKEVKQVVEQTKFNILQFFSRLKAIMPYKIRLYSKLTSIFLQYFERSGSLVMLQYKLNQEINNNRNITTEYRSEEVEYPLERRIIKSQPIDSYTQQQKNSQIQFGIEKIEMWKFSEFIMQNQLRVMSLILKDLSVKCRQQTGKIILPEMCHLQNLLLRLLKLISVKIYDPQQILECCDNLLDILVKQGNQKRVLTENYKNQLYTSISFFIYQILSTKSIPQNSELYYKLVIFIAKAELKYLKNVNPGIQCLVRQVGLKFPRSLYCYTRIRISNMFIQMIESSNKPVYITQFYFNLQFLGNQLKTLFSDNFFSENMEFYIHRRVLVINLDLLQLFLRKLLVPKGFEFPSLIVSTLIDLEHLIYFNIYAKPVKKEEKERRNLYEALIVQLLSFFQTANIRKNAQIQDISLCLQRNSYVNQLQRNSKQVYEFYEENFSFCILQTSQKIKIVQAYPKSYNFIGWKQQFQTILSSYPDLDDKKDIIFSFASMAVEEQKANIRHENFCHKIKPIVLILSAIVIGFTILQRMIHNNPTELTILYQLLIITNLVMLVFVIAERLMMIRKILKLQIKIGKSKSWCSYMIQNKKSFTFWSIFLVFVNINSLFYPNYVSFLFFILFFSKKNGQAYASSAIVQNIKLIFGLLLLASSVIYMFSFLIQAVHEDTLVPVYNFHTNYDISMMIAFVHIWDDSFTDKIKLYYYLSIMMSLVYVFLASIIFYYIQKQTRQSRQSTFCLLCKAVNQNKISQYSNHEINRHIQLEHNIFKFISAFKYILSKQQRFLSLQEKELKQMIIQRNKAIFD